MKNSKKTQEIIKDSEDVEKVETRKVIEEVKSDLEKGEDKIDYLEKITKRSTDTECQI